MRDGIAPIFAVAPNVSSSIRAAEENSEKSIDCSVMMVHYGSSVHGLRAKNHLSYFRNLWRTFQDWILFFLVFLFLSDSGSESGSHKSIRDKRASGPSGDGKPTRVRTVLNEKQLQTLR